MGASESHTALLPDDMLVKKLAPGAVVPTKGSRMSAGYDLHACFHDESDNDDSYICIHPKCSARITTGIAVAIPADSYGRVASRSGLSFKQNVEVGAGVIDADYRGEIVVKLYNHGIAPVRIGQGDRIAQLIIELVLPTNVLIVDELPESERGTAGFGSTGK